MRYVSHIHDFQLSPIVKALILINGVVWFCLVVFLQGLFFNKEPVVFISLGLIPNQVFENFWIWQIFTYMFVHSDSIFPSFI